MNGDKCIQSETGVVLNMRRRPSFKAGCDLSSRVNSDSWEINEDSTEDHEVIEVKVQLFREECAKSECSEA